jgi:uncharacterized protein (TIGR03067 family)
LSTALIAIPRVSKVSRSMLRMLLVSIVLFASQHAWGADLVTDENGPEGIWTAVSAQRDGAAAGELVGNRIEFVGDHFRISKHDAVLFGGSFTTNRKEVPAQIDFKIEEGDAKGQGWLGIFKIEDGILTICDNATNPAMPRPAGFDAGKGSGYVCLRFKR